ncbi:ATP-binding cassette domain-containing protein, partial [Acinetobacter baumannii]
GAAGLLSRWASHVDWIDKAETYLAEVNLGTVRDTVAAALPHGDKRKLEVAIMMALEPDVFMFDEPTAGMGPEETKDMVALIETLAADRTILLVEHKMKMILGLSDR